MINYSLINVAVTNPPRAGMRSRGGPSTPEGPKATGAVPPFLRPPVPPAWRGPPERTKNRGRPPPSASSRRFRYRPSVPHPRILTPRAELSSRLRRKGETAVRRKGKIRWGPSGDPPGEEGFRCIPLPPVRYNEPRGAARAETRRDARKCAEGRRDARRAADPRSYLGQTRAGPRSLAAPRAPPPRSAVP